MIRPFNAGFFLLMAVMIGTIVLLWALLHGRSEQRREAVLIALCVVNIIGFFVYKGFLSGCAVSAGIWAGQIQLVQRAAAAALQYQHVPDPDRCSDTPALLARVCLFRRAARCAFGSGVPGSCVFRLFAVAAADAGILYHAHADPDLRVQPDNTGLLPASAEGSAGRHRGAFDDCICGIPCGPAAAAHRLSAGKLFLRVRAGHRR